jgi:formylglycine-generating enzyme required for sulfatase activity
MSAGSAGYLWKGVQGRAESPGIHLLCIGVGGYQSYPTLNFTAVSALSVFTWFLRAADRGWVHLKSARLLVAPTEVEEKLVVRLRPADHGAWTAARSAGSYANLVDAINAWAAAAHGDQRDTTVFYFAGHGVGLDVRSDWFNTLLLASDFTDNANSSPRAVALRHVVDMLQAVTRKDKVAGSQLFLVDCCRMRTWSGREAEPGDLHIPAMNRMLVDPDLPDERQLAIQFACQPGGTTYGRSNSEAATELGLTHYSAALLKTLSDCARASGAIGTADLLSKTAREFEARHGLVAKIAQADDFPLARSTGAATEALPALAGGSIPQGAARVPAGFQTRGLWVGAAVATTLIAALFLWTSITLRGATITAPASVQAAVSPLRTPAPADPPSSAQASNDGEWVRIPAAPEFLLGSSPDESRGQYDACRRDRQVRRDRAGLVFPCDLEFDASVYSREEKRAPVRIPAFEIERHEVTNEAFVSWLEGSHGEYQVGREMGSGVPTLRNRRGEGDVVAVLQTNPDASGKSRIVFAEGHFRVLGESAPWPVVDVSWLGADAYCHAQGARLPTEKQWERAARGPEARQFPWATGGTVNCATVAYERTDGGACRDLPWQPETVGLSDLDTTTEGVHDLAGNVAEWVDDDRCGSDARDAQRVGCGGIRGGSFRSTGPWLRVILATRHLAKDRTASNIGFRCVRESSP